MAGIVQSTPGRLISWAEFTEACDKLATRLRHDNRIGPSTPVIAVARGGLIPTAIITYNLGLRYVISGFDFISSNRGIYPEPFLVIDDICDTGRTFQTMSRVFPNAVYVAPFVKPQGKEFCTHWVEEVPQDQWVVFPWAPNDEVNR